MQTKTDSTSAAAAKQAANPIENVKRDFADRVKWIQDETDTQDGYWAALLPGWKDRDGVSAVHERSIAGLRASLSDCTYTI